mmetsp:Transcript_23451/g.34586  ORF Transcript_23451/g.34586 Transcript_23451/m.34586 type:complete len:176 (+) Transcript_23451:378-905(+)
MNRRLATALKTTLSLQQQQTSCNIITRYNSPQLLKSIEFLQQQQQQRLMSGTTTTRATFPVTEAINTKLNESFNPTHLEVINESHMHNVPANSETHFKVVVVSSKFESAKGLVQRHRMINGVLSEEIRGPVHALSIVAKTPEQWEKLKSEGKDKIGASPSCRGGDGSLPQRNATA